MKDKQISLSIGATFLFYGALYLLNIFNLLDFLAKRLIEEIIDWRSFFIYLAIFFLIFKNNKILGLVVMILALFIRLNFITAFISPFEYLLLPVAFMLIGIVLVLISLKK